MDRIFFRFFVTFIIFSIPTILNIFDNIFYMPSTELSIINKGIFQDMKEIIPIIAYCGGLISFILTCIDLYQFIHTDENEVSNNSPKAAGIIKNNDVLKETIVNKEIKTIFFESIELRKKNKYIITK